MTSYRIGNLVLQPRRQLLEDGAPVPIGGKALEILSVLAEAEGAVVTKDELMAAVWPGVIVEENAIQVHVAALRKALGPASSAVTTVRGLGYRLQAERAVQVPRPNPPKSVAVLPFADLTGDPSFGRMGEGLAEELINTLARTDSIKIPSRTSSFAYRGRDIDIRQIARELAVEAVLEGSVRAGGDRLRITAQLIDATNGFHIWSENFDRAEGDLLDLQDDLATAIAAALGTRIGVRARDTENVEAKRLQLQAATIASQLSDGSLPNAVALQRRAIALDPHFARAHEGLAGTLLTTGVADLMQRGVFKEARAEAERALELDPSLAGATGILGCLDAMEGRWVSANAHFRAAIRLDGDNSLVHEAYAFYVLAPTGFHALAREHAARALELAPARPMAAWINAVCAGFTGDFPAMSQYLELAGMLGMTRGGIYRALNANRIWFQGDVEAAAIELNGAISEVAQAASGPQLFALVFGALGGQRDPAVASRALVKLYQVCKTEERFWADPVLPTLLITWQTIFSNLDAAFDVAHGFVERHRLGRHVSMVSLGGLWWPGLRPLHCDDRFQEIVEGLGLIEYWKTCGPPDGLELTDTGLVGRA